MKKRLPITGAAGIVLRILFLSVMCVALLYPASARAQDNYEIQVYPSETMAPKTLLIELHSNFTVEGSTTTQFGMLPTQHQEHETIELTEGINDWSEIGFYIFTAEQKRPRRAVGGRSHTPASADPSPLALARGSEPIDASSDMPEPAYSNPTWSWQIMPIVDQTIGRWYWSVNTTMVWDVHVVPAAGGFHARSRSRLTIRTSPRKA